MGGSLTEAHRRLPSLQDLEQAETLLSIPGLDEADRNMGAQAHLQQAALLARIADWAGLSGAAEELGGLHAKFSPLAVPGPGLVADSEGGIAVPAR